MVNVAFELGNQTQEELEYSENIDLIRYDSLLIMGMGGSGVAGDVLSLLSNEVASKNIIVRKSYSVPKKIMEVNPFCLFISYSGNTEETLSGVKDAIKNNLDWAVISSGGKLIDLAIENNKEYIKIPEGLQPRAAFGYLTQAVCKVVDIVEGSNGIWVAIYVGYLAQGGVAFFDGNNWYDWDQSDGIIGANVTGIAIDSYDNTWVSTSTGVSKISSITNINEELYKEDVFYPIPANEVIYFENKNLISVQIFNMLGQEVVREKIAVNQNNIEISHLEEGIYSIISNTKTHKNTQKIIIYKVNILLE